jgi:ABC-type nickel/cobalt efflux system permease component RcnA
MVEKVLGWIRSITEIGLALIALGVVLQIIFGSAVPFLGLDALVKQFGSEGLVGLVSIWVLWAIYSKK